MKPLADLKAAAHGMESLITEAAALQRMEKQFESIALGLAAKRGEIARLRQALLAHGYDPDTLPAEQSAA